VHKQLINACAVVLMAAGASACSSIGSAKAPPPQGSLQPGTALVTINDRALPETHAVKCTPIGSFTEVTTGGTGAAARPGTMTFVSSDKALRATSVSISDLGGFTGSYNAGLQGIADVTVQGYTYTIRGRAEGFETDKPSFKATGTFTIKVAC
jgi:lipoprotein LpqH